MTKGLARLELVPVNELLTIFAEGTGLKSFLPISLAQPPVKVVIW